MENKIEELEKALAEKTRSSEFYYREMQIMQEEIARIHQILDNVRNPPPRSLPKTEENQWPDQYSLLVRLSIWLEKR